MFAKVTVLPLTLGVAGTVCQAAPFQYASNASVGAAPEKTAVTVIDEIVVAVFAVTVMYSSALLPASSALLRADCGELCATDWIAMVPACGVELPVTVTFPVPANAAAVVTPLTAATLNVVGVLDNAPNGLICGTGVTLLLPPPHAATPIATRATSAANLLLVTCDPLQWSEEEGPHQNDAGPELL
jgi:hypothetical protein